MTREDLRTFAAVTLPFAHVLLAAASRPLLVGDEVYVWGYKAAVIAGSGTIDPTAWSMGVGRGPGYPHSVPMAATIPSELLGAFRSVDCRAFAVIAYVAASLALGEVVRLFARGPARWAWTFGLASLPALLDVGPTFMGNAPLVAAAAVTASAVIRDPASTLVPAAAIALALSKIEGAPMALAAVAVAVGAAPRGARGSAALRLVAPFALGIAPWLLLPVLHGVNPLTGEASLADDRARQMIALAGDPLDIVRRSAVVLAALGADLLPFSLGESLVVPRGLLGPFALLAPAFLLSALAGADPRGELAPRRARTLALAVGAALVLGQVASLVASPDFEYVLANARPRFGLHLVPSLVLVALALRAPPSTARVQTV